MVAQMHSQLSCFFWKKRAVKKYFKRIKLTFKYCRLFMAIFIPIFWTFFKFNLNILVRNQKVVNFEMLIWIKFTCQLIKNKNHKSQIFYKVYNLFMTIGNKRNLKRIARDLVKHS